MVFYVSSLRCHEDLIRIRNSVMIRNTGTLKCHQSFDPVFLPGIGVLLIPDSLLVQRRNDTLWTNNGWCLFLNKFDTVPKVAFLRGEKIFKNKIK